MASTSFRKVKSFLFANRFENVGLLCKLSILLAILINTLWLVPHYFPIYESGWLEKIPQASKLQPSSFLIFSYVNNPIIARYFLFAEILAVLNAMRHLRSISAMIPVIFFSMNHYQRAWAVQDGGNNLSHILIFYFLLLMPVNKSSKDQFSLLKNEVKVAFTNSSVFLIRAQIMMMYFAAAISKIQGSVWQKGTALFYIYQSDYFGTESARNLVMKYPGISAVGSYLSILFQLAFCFLVLNRTFRYPLLIIGILFHVGIAITMKLYLFSLTMILAYSAFLDDETAGRILSFFRELVRTRPKWMASVRQE